MVIPGRRRQDQKKGPFYINIKTGQIISPLAMRAKKGLLYQPPTALWNNNWEGKTKIFRTGPAPVPLC
jgi:hypothetical protein